MKIRSKLAPAALSFAAMAVSGAVAFGVPGQSSGSNPSSSASTAPAGISKDDPASSRLSHGKKLILKDGNFQLVRSYERNGDHVRYFSVERGAWEEIPAAMVDWDATEKARIADEQAENALVKRVEAQERAQKIAPVVDVDASLRVGQGAFLPSGEGMFVVTGKNVTHMDQAGTMTKIDKKQRLKQMASPIPIVQGKHYVELPGTRAKLRVDTTSTMPEFYLREIYDPDNPTTIWQSSRQGTGGPEIALVRTTVKGNVRRLKTIKSIMGQEIGAETSEIRVQRWEIAKDVYRFTLAEPLPPGEYALAELLADGMNVFVWDFGVDGAASAKQ
jgi:hypothetical protein